MSNYRNIDAVSPMSDYRNIDAVASALVATGVPMRAGWSALCVAFPDIHSNTLGERLAAAWVDANV